MAGIEGDVVQENHEVEQQNRSVNLVPSIAGTFTYASYQNAIPVIRSLVIENFTDQHFERCVLELSSTPAFLRAKSWVVERLVPGDRISLSDRKIELDPGYLAGLNEAERGEISPRLMAAGKVLVEQCIPVRLLARDEWGGVADMAQLLPAFVMPNDPGVARVLRAAAERLEAHGLPSGLDETALSTFSFAKFLMWKDLMERTEALRQNRVVRHLIDSPEQPFAEGDGGATFPSEYKLDQDYSPAEIVSLLPMDSSQAAACIAAAQGKDFIIIGPPGTGKSQTIANMIANCLAAGKTVLFVAEKTAALDVVHRRLKEYGLGSHCIELHSNKADRRYFLSQLKAAWEHGGRIDLSEWIAVNDRLKLRRDELNAYVAALHKRYPNGWTPYYALGMALKDPDALIHPH